MGDIRFDETLVVFEVIVVPVIELLFWLRNGRVFSCPPFGVIFPNL